MHRRYDAPGSLRLSHCVLNTYSKTAPPRSRARWEAPFQRVVSRSKGIAIMLEWKPRECRVRYNMFARVCLCIRNNDGNEGEGELEVVGGRWGEDS